jgi:hypothetical protein
MPPRISVLRALTCATLILAAGCSTTSGAPSATPSSPATSNALPTNGAPNVNNPLDIGTAVTDPCGLVTKEQVEALGGKIKSVAPDNNSTTNACAWIYDNFIGDITAGMLTQNTEGLSSSYYEHSRGGLPVFQPIASIEGQPGLIFSRGSFSPARCFVLVGVRNDLVYYIGVNVRGANPYVSDPCGLATKFATFAIQHLKGA